MAGRPSRGFPEVEKREQYARLIGQGLNNSEACRIVGINRRTGTRWRYGRTVIASDGTTRHHPGVINNARRPLSDRYLSEDERILIADRRRAGATVRAIAGELRRSPSTVSRELRRNADTAGRYYPFHAERRALERRRRGRPGKLATDPALRAMVQKHLELLWSPEQIADALPGWFPDQPDRHLAHETIYRRERGGLRRDLPRVLRTRRTRRRMRRRPDARRHGTLVGMRMLTERPAEAANRAVAGHWEGDLIVGERNGSAIATPRRTLHPLRHAAARGRQPPFGGDPGWRDRGAR